MFPEKFVSILHPILNPLAQKKLSDRNVKMLLGKSPKQFVLRFHKKIAKMFPKKFVLLFKEIYAISYLLKKKYKIANLCQSM